MLLNNKTIDLLDYNLEELIFTRDMTGANTDKLTIKKGETVVYEDEHYFSTKKPADELITKDGVYSVLNDVQIIVKTNSDYTGTKYNEVVMSTNANEKFNLKTGNDIINFSGNIGEDEVTFNKEENLLLDFANTGYVKCSVSGKDAVIDYLSKENDSILGQVTVKDYAAKKIQGSRVDLMANGYDYQRPLYYYEFAPDFDGDTYTGSWLDELFISTTSDDNIDLKTGFDSVIYNVTKDETGLVGWGKDEITLTKGEEIDIWIDEEYMLTVAENTYKYTVVNEYEIVGNDLIITSTAKYNEEPLLPEEYNNEYDLGTIKLLNAAKKSTGASIFINDENIFDTDTPFITYDEKDVTLKKVLTGTEFSDGVDLRNYISPDGKGVKIDTKGGSDTIIGSYYNDTVKSSSGDNVVYEYGGTNNITTGDGYDVVITLDSSSNTINTGEDIGLVRLFSNGINNVTCGSDIDYIYAYNGQNTINAGNGSNLVRIQGGINTVTTGKDRDDIEIEIDNPLFPNEYSNNVIKTGSGADKIDVNSDSYNVINAGNGGKNSYGDVVGNIINLNNGVNTITSGKHADKVNITAGQNIINSGAGNDIITVSGGKNIINGDNGNDTYNVDITKFTDELLINDTKGKNILNLGKDNTATVNILFDVSLNKKGKAIYDQLLFSTESVADVGEDGFDYFDGVRTLNKKVISKLEYGDETKETYKSYTLKTSEIDKLANDIASWLNSKPDYNSTDDVFVSGNAEDIGKLMSAYTNFADNGYVFNSENSLNA